MRLKEYCLIDLLLVFMAPVREDLRSMMILPLCFRHPRYDQTNRADLQT